MSLNICIASHLGIHQSADLRLTEFSKTNFGWTSRPIIAPSPKIVVLQYFGWQAAITYVGIANLGGFSTVDWLTGMLTHPQGQRSVSDVIERIRTEATRELAQISLPPNFPRYHTFTVGVLTRDQPPQVIMISNYEFLNKEPQATAATDFLVSAKILGSKKRTLVVTAGVGEAVTRDDKSVLIRLVRDSEEAGLIRTRIAEVNKRASEQPQSRSFISPSCLVFSLFPDGTGAGELHGPVNGKLMVSTITGGTDLTATVEQIFSKLRPGEQPVFRGATFVSGQRNSEERRAYRAND
jgi:hypothetical protein